MTYSDDDMLIKHGKPKKHQEDEVQLAAQAMCMEEQYGIHIEYGAIFYAEIRHRIEVAISEELRQTVTDCVQRMHEIFSSGQLPAIQRGKHCERCVCADGVSLRAGR